MRGVEGDRLAHWEGRPTPEWEGDWGVPHFEAWSAVRSTNDRVRALAERGLPPFTVVVAEEQTAGRGRAGRHWASPAGLGLWLSVLLPAAVRSGPGPTALLVGLATCRAVERAAEGLSARLKWPNDVLLGERKVAGVLCEATPRGVVAGIGINVRQRLLDFDEDLRGRAVSLQMAAGREVSRARLAAALLGELQRLLASPPARLDGALAGELARRDALLGSEVLVEGAGPGVARGIDAAGRLTLEVAPGEVRTVVAGSVSVVKGERP